MEGREGGEGRGRERVKYIHNTCRDVKHVKMPYTTPSWPLPILSLPGHYHTSYCSWKRDPPE